MVPSSQSDRRVLWHPRQDTKFVVGGGTQITLYEWTPEFPEIRHITSQHDLQFMKCFAWSPDATYDDLFAVGLTTGRVDLIRLEASKSARQANLLTSGPTVSLPVRNSRSCNVVTFCATDPNYLAVGLDKVRGEPSLVVWDISAASSTFAQASPNPNFTSNVQPRPNPQLPRAELGSRIDHRIVQQHASTEVVSSLSFIPKSTHLLLAGISYRWLRLFDLRNSIPSTSHVAAKVHGIATDPFDQHRIACHGDGIVSIWDARKLNHPLLTFTEKDALHDGARIRPNSIYSCIEFSSTRRGMLATMEKDASYVRFWDLLESQASLVEESPDGAASRDSSSASRTTRKSWANLPWTAGVTTPHLQPQARETETHPSLMACGTFRTKDFPRPLASFALVPSPHSHPLTSNVMVVNREGDLELYAVHDTPKQAVWSGRGELAIGAGKSFRFISGFQDISPPPEPWDAPASDANHLQQKSSPRSRSHSLQRLDGSVRGRSGPRTNGSNSPALFGRGDDEGFPALSLSPYPTSIAASNTYGRSAKSRTYSPMSFRKYSLQYEYSSYQKEKADNGSRVSRSKGPSDRPGGRISQDNSSSRIRKQQPLKALGHVVADDISMVMRSRVIKGYGLSRPQDNTYITHDEPDGLLTETWAWLNHSREILCTPTARVGNHDFTYEGLLGIWEGFRPMSNQPTEPSTAEDLLGAPGSRSRRSRSPNGRTLSAFHTALTELAARRNVHHSDWKPTISTSKLLQRQIALDLCGWSLKQDDLSKAIKRWENDGKYSRAACWLIFTRQYSKALDVLMRSEDEIHHMMSGTLAALIPHGSSSSSMNLELREHCERLIVRLQDPYLRAILTHLTLGDWSEILDEEILPFRERLAIAFQFLDDKSLSSYLRRCIERSSASGDIDCLIVAGLTKPGLDILQGYVDHTGDVQTAAIMASFVSPWKFVDRRVDHWLDSYRDILDGFKLFHHRVNFDVERGNVIQAAIQNGDIPRVDYVPRQISMRCNYCNKQVSPPNSAAQSKGRVNACPNCARPLPRCSVCLMNLSIVYDGQREAQLTLNESKDTIDDAIVICQTCRHGGHASHLLDWFFGADSARSHGICPVADCNCRCADEY
ncbi:hypothetical protein PC9H_009664 [Pleurotus ostreatus]|uniref:Uncharacterized protein n=1 Tax=Pleurotus ostreatus TaxID=5322 RepID=A0A8H6ZQ52_PLEOS|nr:uncharacterized protein PC9H_009664 [Pleurotus ostreatus]KAF7424357.1 hypothetical protein PC9H_009664 [Pleurotus ostreatus]